MGEFRKLSDTFYASPQVSPQDISEAAAMGMALVVNNRPDGEAADQPEGAAIEAATRAAGMDYLA
ncbi:MAG TPA: TIGR01244 family phosphatase, partial [Erythrobacter sp.]|nr:TIGR01244 family phosphatase [Erythrobacter sp.]